ncbi:MAG: Pr6Pr family membrane protein, partial [Vicinamibacterales bacterium]
MVSLSLTRDAGRPMAIGLWHFVGYFTILTNVRVAFAFTRLARGVALAPSAFTGVVLAIAVVGVVYDTILAAVVPPMTPAWAVADRLLHYVMPVATVAWWIAFTPKAALAWTDAARWLRYPLLYLVYALGRGAVDDWYPYFFINASRLGYARTLVNAAALTLAMFVAGLLLIAVTRFARGVSRR